ncbi:MAG: hypothetical protein ABI867_33000, partial [Kofleriaceae bacterium]
MKCLLFVCLLAGVAEAGATKPPEGWTADPTLAASVANQASRQPHFGGLKATATAEAFRAPDLSGALYITRVVANATDAQRNQAASTELDELTAVLTRQNTKPAEYREENGTNLLRAFVVWTASGNVTTWSQMIVAGDAQQLVAVTAECVFNAEAPKPAIQACTNALGQLEAGIDLKARVPLERTRPSATPAPAPAAGSQSRNSSLVEGGVPVLPPRQIPADRQRERDDRPIYVGGGLVVFAALFWWNRKRREKFEKEDGGEPPTARRAKRRDADADDLHAAAADDGKEEPRS